MFLESSCYSVADIEILKPSLAAPVYTYTNTGKYNFLFLHFGSGSVRATPNSDYPVLVPDALMSGVSATPDSGYGVEVLDTDLPSVTNAAYSIYGIESVTSTPSALILNISDSSSIASILSIDPILDSGLTFADSSATGLVLSGLGFSIDPSILYTSGSSTISDNSGNGLTGTLVGSPTYSASPPSFTFTGSQYISFGTNSVINVTNNFTVEAWVNIQSFNYNGCIMTFGSSSDEQWSLATNSDSTVNLTWGWPKSWQWAASSPRTANVWFCVQATYQSGVVNIYINGVLDVTRSLNGAAMTAVPSPHLEIGREFPGGYEYLYGKVGAVRMYNRVLSSAEAAQNFAARRSIYGV